ncbi:hypothetical protein CC1G_15309 [Coprinopsis cinerea okayama7|uniref:Uncharacterized protein n=1 Tax=Coprinopsis cinerea (strain Okayama-7 / 130 / ATCC MYA-4618 / FGSC 9003) TaxID=240176 RepID=D6RPY8_COPC7|nr:hypothetical protein CC1G_15309 [Coprinopsis cinerea okayama7\|eukprot:XP_002910402.1 hypothetical protein CC1G_15309 [Coprinopsis cinerea okayama7\
MFAVPDKEIQVQRKDKTSIPRDAAVRRGVEMALAGGLSGHWSSRDAKTRNGNDLIPFCCCQESGFKSLKEGRRVLQQVNTPDGMWRLWLCLLYPAWALERVVFVCTPKFKQDCDGLNKGRPREGIHRCGLLRFAKPFSLSYCPNISTPCTWDPIAEGLEFDTPKNPAPSPLEKKSSSVLNSPEAP